MQTDGYAVEMWTAMTDGETASTIKETFSHGDA